MDHESVRLCHRRTFLAASLASAVLLVGGCDQDKDKCPDCEGQGAKLYKCPTCDGKKQLMGKECANCQGSGSIGALCGTCGGSKRKPSTKK